MIQKTILLLCFFISTTLFSQIHEVGVFLGGSNFIGDVGSTTYINPEKLAVGVLYKWNKTPRHSYRASYNQSNIIGNDLNSSDPSRKLRGYRFENNIKEISLGLEFNFFDFNLHNAGTKFTPYIYSGLNIIRNTSMYFIKGQAQADYRHNTIGLPITLGIKTNLNNRFILGLETGARYTLTDAIDGSKPDDENLSIHNFGNLNNNDWYVFTGFTLTYTFGEKPCYCVE